MASSTNNSPKEAIKEEEAKAEATKAEAPKAEVSKISGSDDLEKMKADEANVIPAAPDGGYAWLIVALTFVIFGYVYGISLGFASLIYTELLDYFGSTKPTASWVASLQYSFVFLAGKINLQIKINNLADKVR